MNDQLAAVVQVGAISGMLGGTIVYLLPELGMTIVTLAAIVLLVWTYVDQ